MLASAVASAPYFAENIKGTLSVPNFFDNFDIETNTIKNEVLDAELSVQIEKLKQFN